MAAAIGLRTIMESIELFMDPGWDFLHGGLEWESIRLRNVCESDLSTVMDIHKSIRYYDDIAGEAFKQEDALAVIRRTDLPPNGSKEFFSAKMILTSDNQPAGYLVIYEGYPQQNALWIGSLFLNRKYHRRGIGNLVMKMVEAYAGKCGFKSLGLGVYAQNTDGLQFWLKQGFSKIEAITVNEYGRAILRLDKRL